MNINELVSAVSLEDVRCIETRGHLILNQDDGVTAWTASDPVGELKLDVHPVSWGTTMETWFRLELRETFAVISSAFAVIYRRDSEDQIPEDVRKEFMERVAFMACYPYLRESIARQASDLRLGNVVLPIIRQGEVKIDLKPDGGEPAAT